MCSTNLLLLLLLSHAHYILHETEVDECKAMTDKERSVDARSPRTPVERVELTTHSTSDGRVQALPSHTAYVNARWFS